jgi:predicted flap endonuclease-1-like 5' DNA nuclease
MVARKYSASMDEQLLDEVAAAADAEGATMSAWLAQAARDRLALLGLGRVVDEWQREHGAFTDAEIAAAERAVAASERPDQILGSSARRARRSA